MGVGHWRSCLSPSSITSLVGFRCFSQGRLRRYRQKRWTGRCSGRTAGWSQRCSTPRPGPSTPKSCWRGSRSVSVWVSKGTGGGIKSIFLHVGRQQLSSTYHTEVQKTAVTCLCHGPYTLVLYLSVCSHARVSL